MLPRDEVDESVLDDPDRLLSADPGGHLRLLAAAGATVRRTISAAAEAGADQLARDGLPRAVVLIANGAALDAAEAMVLFAGAQTPVPLVVHRVHRDTGLPRWVGAADLVLAANADGVDPVVAESVVAAGGRGARVAVVGPGDSPLAAAVSGARGIFVEAPEADPFWPAYAGLLCLLRETGLITAPDELLELLIERMDDRAVQSRPASESFVNPAKTLALQLVGSIPMVGAGSQAGELAARAFIRALGTVAGYPAVPFDPAYLGGGLASTGDSDDIFRDRVEEPGEWRLQAVLLREEDGDPVVDRMRDLVTQHDVGAAELVLEAGPDPVRYARAVAELQFAAAYLAILLGVDPSRSIRPELYGTVPNARFQGER